MDTARLKEAGRKLLANMSRSIPVLIGVLLLIGLVGTVVPPDLFRRLFTGSRLLDPLIGALFGGVAAGNPLTSYVIGGELLAGGVSLIAVVAFIVSWVTVGVVQLPAESLMLGRRFALARNAASFLAAVVIALLTVLTVELL